MFTKLSSKGQLIIPKKVRQALGLKYGDRFHVHIVDGNIVLEPIKPSAAAALYGKYPGVDFLTELEEEHRQEILHEKKVRS